MDSGRMTSPRLGVVRESMMMDPLLIKAPLGKARSRGLPVPGPDFTFGTSCLIRDGGVAEALSTWRVQSGREDSAQQMDFVSLNRDAVRSGLVTSKELSRYRAQMGGVKVQNQSREHNKGRTSRRPLVVPDMTFGMRNRPSSPLADVLAHEYGHRWIEQQLSRNPTSNHKHTTGPGRVAETRTSRMRMSRSLQLQQTHFTQFSKVGPVLDTFMDPSDRQRAVRTHQNH